MMCSVPVHCDNDTNDINDIITNDIITNDIITNDIITNDTNDTYDTNDIILYE